MNDGFDSAHDDKMILRKLTREYPILLRRLNTRFLREFRDSEEGRWDDAGRPSDGEAWTDDEGAEGVPLAFNILGRHKSMIEVRSAPELAEVWWALYTGTAQHHATKAAQTLALKLLPLCEELGVTTEDWPDGH